MAFYPELKGPALAAHNDMLAQMIGKAGKELNLSDADLVKRSLRPEDLGLSNPVWSFNVATGSANNTIINAATIADNRFVGINGFCHNPTTKLLTQLTITRRGGVARIWNIEAVQHQESKLFFVDDPIVIDQNTTITVVGYNSSASTNAAYPLQFLGAVVEKRGLLIA